MSKDMGMGKKRFAIVGGSPFSSYTGTVTFTDLKVHSQYDTLEEVEENINLVMDECAGLVLVLDRESDSFVVDK